MFHCLFLPSMAYDRKPHFKTLEKAWCPCKMIWLMSEHGNNVKDGDGKFQEKHVKCSAGARHWEWTTSTEKSKISSMEMIKWKLGSLNNEWMQKKCLGWHLAVKALWMLVMQQTIKLAGDSWQWTKWSKLIQPVKHGTSHCHFVGATTSSMSQCLCWQLPSPQSFANWSFWMLAGQKA